MSHYYAMQQLVRSLEEAITGRPLHGSRKNGYFHYIPHDERLFLEGLEEAIKLLKKTRVGVYGAKFCDVGCGIGSKLILAETKLLRVTGIEFDKKLAKVAEGMLKGFGRAGKVIVGDALKQSYKDYDLIYYYRPISDLAPMQQLREEILSTMHDDALVLSGTGCAVEVMDKHEYKEHVDSYARINHPHHRSMEPLGNA